VAHRAISLLSLRVVWSLTGNPPCDHVRARHCCVRRNPPQRSLRGVVRTRGIKYNWFNVVLSFLTMGLTLCLIFFVRL
jgi:hypothetical protein